jgi:hypothetical protein
MDRVRKGKDQENIERREEDAAPKRKLREQQIERDS